MALAINDFSSEGDTRDRLSRVLGVAAALYGLLALIAGGMAAVGVLGLAGLAADPDAIGPARMLAMPWSLAAGGDAVTGLAITLGALAVNLAILLVGSRLIRGRVIRR